MNETKHGCRRVRKRIGIKKKNIKKFVNDAFNKGISHCEAKGQLKRYIGFLYQKHQKANNIKIYNSYVWIFDNDTLITVFFTTSKLFKKKITITTETKGEIKIKWQKKYIRNVNNEC